MKNYKIVRVRIFLSGLLCMFFMCSGFANPCDRFKKEPDINLKKAEWNVTVVPSEEDIWPEGGYVKIQAFDRLEPKITYTFNGKYYCVFVSSVDATVGFKDFEITINKKYAKDSCEYNAVLEHEHHHIKDAEDAFDEIFPEIGVALYDSVDAVQPIYTEDPYEVPYAVEKIQKQIRENKKLMDLVEKFSKKQVSDAANLDRTPDANIRKCAEDKMKDAFDKYYKKKGIKK